MMIVSTLVRFPLSLCKMWYLTRHTIGLAAFILCHQRKSNLSRNLLLTNMVLEIYQMPTSQTLISLFLVPHRSQARQRHKTILCRLYLRNSIKLMHIPTQNRYCSNFGRMKDLLEILQKTF